MSHTYSLIHLFTAARLTLSTISLLFEQSLRFCHLVLVYLKMSYWRYDIQKVWNRYEILPNLTIRAILCRCMDRPYFLTRFSFENGREFYQIFVHISIKIFVNNFLFLSVIFFKYTQKFMSIQSLYTSCILEKNRYWKKM